MYFLPALLAAQTVTDTNGTVEPDDSTEQTTKKIKPKKQGTNTGNSDATDYRKNGLFQAIIHAGFNAAQIDGDNYHGYNKFGFDGGVAAMVRFHKYVSVSMSLDFSMKGAKAALKTDNNPADSGLYKVKLNYIEIPIMLNIHDKKIVMFSIGPQISFLVGYKEYGLAGNDITNNPKPYFGYGQPAKVQLDGVAALHFIIKDHFGFGGKFTYSILKMRGAAIYNRYPGEYNNVLTFDVEYILSTVKKK
jgi:hypothetical protein